MPRRTRLATGIFKDAHGISVIVPTNGKPVEHRFDPGTPTEKLIKWRSRQLQINGTRAPREARGTLARDAINYLKPLKGRPGHKAEKSHVRAWLSRFPGWPRWKITRKDVELAISDWRQRGVSARTIRHRCRVLTAIYTRLDGPNSETPLDNVKVPAAPRSRPVSVSDDVIATVARNLQAQEQPKSRKGFDVGRGRLKDAKSRARFLVLATHPQRPAEMQRAKPEDVDLEQRLWFVRGAKNSYNVIVPLNDEQVAAWELFIAADAWGAYDTRSFARVLRTAGWPKGIRPYNLRHSTAVAALLRGISLGDVQGLLGHTSPDTTRRFYAGVQIATLRAATAVLDGRLDPRTFALPRTISTSVVEEGAKGRENTRLSRGPDMQKGRPSK